MPIVTRSVLQIITEVPIEDEALVLAVTGGTMAHPGKDIWLAQARLSPGSDAGNKPPASDGEAGPQPQQRIAAPASRLTKQAGIACNDPVFRTFLWEKQMLRVLQTVLKRPPQPFG